MSRLNLDLGVLQRTTMRRGSNKVLKALLLIFSFELSPCKANLPYKIIETSTGRMRGFLVNDEYVWLGIPYAVPPLGKLRFLRPEPFPKFEHLYEATRQPNACFQNPGEGLLKPRANISEDCLYINIHTPIMDRYTLLPVVIWLHGEGYFNGSISALLYDPAVMVKKGNVVFVGVQYRLGSFGFLYTGQEALGNMGLQDQLLALKWIHQNIKLFGGDPNKITLMGQDAGANSAAIHIIHPNNSAYFQRAILQSSGGDTPWWIVSKSAAKKRAEMLGKQLGCVEFVCLEECLRNFKPESILQIESNPDIFSIMAYPFYAFVPIVDHEVILRNPRTTIKDILKGKAKMKDGMSLLLGSNANEGYYELARLIPKIYDLHRELTKEEMMINDIQFKVLFEVFFKEYSTKVQEQILEHYPRNGSEEANFLVLGDIVADSTFVCSVEQFAEAGSESGNSVYRYNFEYHSKHNPLATWTGAGHGSELEFTFGLPFAGLYMYSPIEVEFGQKIIDYWTSFIKTGDPNMLPLPLTWPKYTKKLWKYLRLNPSHMKTGSVDLYNRCNFWINEMPRLKKKSL